MGDEVSVILGSRYKVLDEEVKVPRRGFVIPSTT